MAYIIVFTNLKGGVGKTSDTDMMSLVASQIFHKKVLLIDVDLQANSTQNMSRTFNNVEYPQSFTNAVMEGSLKRAIVSLSSNLDFIAGSAGTHDLNEWILDHSKNKKGRYLFFKNMIEELQDGYDYIFFDVAPSTDNAVDAIMMCCDYIIPVQEVKRFSMDGTASLISNYLTPMVEAFPEKAHFQVAGVLPAIFQNRKRQQQINYEETVERYGQDNVFFTIIKRLERLDRFGEHGITLNDYQDRKIWAIFADLLLELEARITSFEQTGDILDFKFKPIYYDIENNKELAASKEIKLNGIDQ